MLVHWRKTKEGKISKNSFMHVASKSIKNRCISYDRFKEDRVLFIKASPWVEYDIYKFIFIFSLKDSGIQETIIKS